MKRSLLLLLSAIALSSSMYAQSVIYRTVKVDFSVGGFPGSGNTSSGNLSLEFQARCSDEFAIGLRGQLAFNNNTYGSVCLTGDYYIPSWDNKGGARIFVGGGIGNFNESKFLSNDPGTNNIGFFPRIGLEAGHFRLAAEFDDTGGLKNYGAIDIGFFLGGGKKK